MMWQCVHADLVMNEYSTKNEIINPLRLSAAEKEILFEELYPVQCAIFDGIDREPFRRFIIKPDADTRLCA